VARSPQERAASLDSPDPRRAPPPRARARHLKNKKAPTRETPAPSQTRNLTGRRARRDRVPCGSNGRDTRGAGESGGEGVSEGAGSDSISPILRWGQGMRGCSARWDLGGFGSGEESRKRRVWVSDCDWKGVGEEWRIRFLNRAIWLTGGDDRWSRRSYLLPVSISPPVCVWMLTCGMDATSWSRRGSDGPFLDLMIPQELG
jgi:hypothetical protein